MTNDKAVRPRILIVEDEESIVTLLAYNLQKEGFEVHTTGDGEEALYMAGEIKPDLILLDWMLPSLSGVEVCSRLRKKEATRGIPIIMLTARSEEADLVTGLSRGADDYITKPFSPREVVARIHAVLRRMRPMFEAKMLQYGGITVDMTGHKAYYKKKQIHLGPKEFRLLCHLMEHPGRVFSREQLLDAVWGQDNYVDPRTVDVHVRRVRKVLEDCKPGLESLIHTVRSAGYTMEENRR